MWFSPDGEHKKFILPEKDLQSVDYVQINATGAKMSPDLYTYNKFTGWVTFESTETFTGNGTAIGSKTATFTIKAKNMKSFKKR